MSREPLRPKPGTPIRPTGDTLTDQPKTDPVMDSLVEGFRCHAVEFKRRHVENTPGHQDGCETCKRIEDAIKEIGGGDEG